MDLNQEDQQGQEEEEEEEEEDHLMITTTKFLPKYKSMTFGPPLPRPPPPQQEAINFMDLSLDHHQQAANCWPPDYEREHMFDKVVTPSDVGKLNRLVIPKQHAEKYFPLDPASTEKGLLLNFVDRTGKPWRFRYSYWNSSQSYVMTKGWSRFVKEKKLDAGDIVSFERGVGDWGRQHFYIDWRRRPLPPPPPPPPSPHHHLYHYGQFGNCYNDVRWGGGGGGRGGGRLYSVLQRPMSVPVRLSSHEHLHHPYHHHHQMINQQYNLNHQHHHHDNNHVVHDQYPIVIDSVPFIDHQHGVRSTSMMSSSSSTSSGGTSGGKRLRLFGVNMNIVNQEAEEDFHQTVGEQDLDLHRHCQILPSTAIPFQHRHLVPASSIFMQLPNAMSSSSSTTPTPADHYLYSSSHNKGKSFYLDP